jgi:hypothetical protein
MKQQHILADMVRDDGISAVNAISRNRRSPDAGSTGFSFGPFSTLPLTQTYEAFMGMPPEARAAVLSLAGQLLLRFGPALLDSTDRDFGSLTEMFGMKTGKGKGVTKEGLRNLTGSEIGGMATKGLSGFLGLTGYGAVFSPFLNNVSEILMKDEPSGQEGTMAALSLLSKKASRRAQKAKIMERLLNPPSAVPAKSALSETLEAFRTLQEMSGGADDPDDPQTYQPPQMLMPAQYMQSQYSQALPLAYPVGASGYGAYQANQPQAPISTAAVSIPGFQIYGQPMQDHNKRKRRLPVSLHDSRRPTPVSLHDSCCASCARGGPCADEETNFVTACGRQFDYCGGDLQCKLKVYREKAKEGGWLQPEDILADLSENTIRYTFNRSAHDASCKVCRHDGYFSDDPIPSGLFYKSGLIEGRIKAMGEGQFGEIDVGDFPFQVTLNSEIKPSRREASLVHETLHALTELHKIPMEHSQLHTLAVGLTTEILPAVLALRRAETAGGSN